jgi:hypothetical protein
MIGFFSMLVLVSVSAGVINYIQGSANEFVTYENSTEGVKIDYPKGWSVIRQYGLAFLSPKENDSDSFREGLVVARGPVVNESIDKLADRVLRFYNLTLIDFRLNESKGITIHASPAQSLIYTFTIPDNGTIKALDLGTRENNRVHVFRYTAQESKFDHYLPTIERMIASFKSVE